VRLLARSAFAVICLLGLGGPAWAGEARPDGFGKLPAAGAPNYSRYVRQSLYVPTRDGTRLAVDVFRPMTEAGVEEKPLPVIFYYARYWRARQLPDGSVVTDLGVLMKGQTVGALISRDSSGRLLFWDTGRESIPEIMRHGYVFVRAEARGAGASEGVRVADFTPREAQDGADLVDWIARQPWSNGKVGMTGGSYPGITQLTVAAEAPPALKAIFPAAPALDLYRLASAGTGALHKGMIGFQVAQARSDGLDVAKPVAGQVVPVDDDPDGAGLAKILQDRRQNTPPDATMRALYDLGPRFGDTLGALASDWGAKDLGAVRGTVLDVDALIARQRAAPAAQAKAQAGLSLDRDAPAYSGSNSEGMRSPHLLLPALNRSRVPTYVWSGWYDMDTVGATQLFRNLQGPKKLTIGPWSHGPNEDNGTQRSPLIRAEAQSRELMTAEAIRWFDYWLKGVDNGVMADPPVHYGYAADRKVAWAAGAAWPAADAVARTFYFSGARSGTVASVNDGTLSATPARRGEAAFKVDYRATMGGQSRYHDSLSGAPEMAYPDLVEHARGGLTFTGPVLDADLLVVGHPVVALDARSTAPDGDLFFYLEDVAPDGASYVSEAVARASHRVQGQAPYDAGGLPFSDSRRAVVDATPPFNRGLERLTVDFQPTAYRFKAGHRIRVVITGADADNYITPPILPEPQIGVALGGVSGAAIVLPVAPAAAGAR